MQFPKCWTSCAKALTSPLLNNQRRIHRNIKQIDHRLAAFIKKYAALKITRYPIELYAATRAWPTQAVATIAATMARNPAMEPAAPKGDRNGMDASCSRVTVLRNRTCAASDTSQASIPPIKAALMM